MEDVRSSFRPNGVCSARRAQYLLDCVPIHPTANRQFEAAQDPLAEVLGVWRKPQLHLADFSRAVRAPRKLNVPGRLTAQVFLKALRWISWRDVFRGNEL